MSQSAPQRVERVCEWHRKIGHRCLFRIRVPDRNEGNDELPTAVLPKCRQVAQGTAAKSRATYCLKRSELTAGPSVSTPIATTRLNHPWTSPVARSLLLRFHISRVIRKLQNGRKTMEPSPCRCMNSAIFSQLLRHRAAGSTTAIGTAPLKSRTIVWNQKCSPFLSHTLNPRSGSSRRDQFKCNTCGR